jgi:hypothetical protein
MVSKIVAHSCDHQRDGPFISRLFHYFHIWRSPLFLTSHLLPVNSTIRKDQKKFDEKVTEITSKIKIKNVRKDYHPE